MTRRFKPLTEFRSSIGRRAYWRDDGVGVIEPGGTITGVISGTRGHAKWIIQWDDGSPEWWSTTIPVSTKQLRIDDPS